MFLFLIKSKTDLPKNDNPWEPWYDKYDGFVIRAETEEQARAVAQKGGADEIARGDRLAWTNSKYSTCEMLREDGKEEIVLSSFNAA